MEAMKMSHRHADGSSDGSGIQNYDWLSWIFGFRRELVPHRPSVRSHRGVDRRQSAVEAALHDVGDFHALWRRPVVEHRLHA
jgi:hypothetical protein